jgi:hypothetical protein
MNHKKCSGLEKYLVVSGLAALLSLALTTTTVQAAEKDDGEAGFTVLIVRIETNTTDNDAEVVIIAESETGLKELKVLTPNNKTAVSLSSKTSPQLGQAQVLVETAELSLDQVKASYPAGVYQFRGKTVDGEKLEGVATLSHTLLSAPVISTPSKGATGVPVAGQVITWAPVAGANGYFLELEDVTTKATLKIDLAKTATSFAIPNGLLSPNTEYELGIAVIGADGNRVFTEISFTTGS